MNKIKLFVILGIILLMGNFIGAVELSFCCERTTDGAWCQNAPVEECNAQFRKSPTSCESTSYCKLGCCYSSNEGTCMENTPQRVCEASAGIWSGESATCDIPQCQLGCCLIGDQAAFTTKAKCKKLATLYGLEVNYQSSITNEVQCILSTVSDVKGACVYTNEDYEKDCDFITKRECDTIKITKEDATFNAGYLCSSNELNTTCARTEKTTCVDGRDEVFFVDSCGNLANVYDASKIDDVEYWSKVSSVTDSCGYGESNADSATCGNCNYYAGSTCKEYKRSEDRVKPNYGENLCRDLGCTWQGERYEHGETWCAESGGVSSIFTKKEQTNVYKENLPGSRYFRLVCYDREVSVEPCADFRNEVCLQSTLNGFRTAGCVVNKWQDCTQQTKQKDCENLDKRDCKWIIPEKEAEAGEVACVPRYAPGTDFWNSEGETEEICSLGTTQCEVKYSKGLLGEEKCVENCDCLTDSWKNQQEKVCMSLGDCGNKTNYIGRIGWNYDNDPITKD